MKKIFLYTSIFLILVSFLSGCTPKTTENQEANAQKQTEETESKFMQEFTGEKGEFVEIENNQILIAANNVSDGKAHYFNTQLPGGESVYFFVVKSPDGNLRAAANGCQVCGPALQGFHQDGDTMVCNTCGNAYPLNKIATEKGGCNPAPINPDLEVIDGNVSITLDQLEEVKQFFK